MSTRRPHKRTRLGCLQCKRRHIKCDEGKPQCDNCTDNGLTCRYSCSLRNKVSLAIADSSTQSNRGLGHSLQHRHQLFQSFASDTPPTFDLVDMELLHHWTSNNAIYMVDSYASLTPAVVRLGLANPFVLYGILGLSALHLGHLNPNRRDFYLVKSFTHQSLALQAFRTALKDINRNNCEAVAAFSILLSALSYGDHRVSQINNLNHIDRMIMSMEMVRGAATILMSWKDVILDGEIGLIFRSPIFNLMPTGEIPQLVALYEFLNQPPPELNAAAAKESAKAVDSLHRMFAVNDNAVQNGISGFRAALAWPVHVSVDYMHLLGRREPCALAVLAYYVILLHEYKFHWMMQEWTIKLLSSIDSQLNDDIWEVWMVWPKQMVSKGGDATREELQFLL